MVKVTVKWSKQKYEVDVDPTEGLEVLQGQLFCLTNVPVDRQTIMLKGKKMKEDADLQKIKEKSKLILMGSADTMAAAPKEKIVFEEDLTDEQKGVMLPDVGAGLANLGNTCYLNSTLQCLRHAPDLKTALTRYTPPPSADLGGMLTSSMGRLFQKLDASGSAVTPGVFVQVFRNAYQQFDERSPQTGGHMQQDADEAWQSIMTSLANNLSNVPAGVNAQNMVDHLFGIPMTSTMKCVESEDEPVKEATEVVRKLRCTINSDVNYMRDGLLLGMEEKIEKNSPTLGRPAQYLRTNKVSALPKYIVVQFVRFFWKKKENMKSKILRKVQYPTDFDILEFCDKKLKRSLTAARTALVDEENKKLGLDSLDKMLKPKKKAKKDPKKEAEEAKAAEEKKAREEEEAKMDPPAPTDTSGHYNLISAVTHKGRAADAGHYVGWCRQKDDEWMKFDDEVVSNVKTDDILKLCGGGDWHMTYICVYERTDDMIAFRERDAKAAKEAEEGKPAPMEE